MQTLTGVKGLSAGQSHALAVTHDGRLFAWGSNGSGRLGDGTTTTRTSPVAITVPSTVAQVAAGNSHSLALTVDGSVYAWGVGSNGQLGLGSTSSVNVPTQISTLSNIVAIAAGGTHSLAVGSDGQVYAWGLNSSGQVGDGTNTQRTSPTLVSIAGVTSVAAGGTHTLARTQDGSVYAWGAGSSGQLGLGSTSGRNSPGLIAGLSATTIAAGDSHSAALRTDGVLVTWGANGSGRLGDGTTSTRTTPTAIAGVIPVLIAAGGSHTVAVGADGTVWTWGAGNSGQLGDGNTPTRTSPSAISEPGYVWRTATPVFSVSSGTYTTDRSVVVTLDTTGAVIHYTQNGNEPTESDPAVAIGGTIVVNSSQTLKAKAWKTGMPASATTTGVYVMKVVTPTFAPSGASYTTPQSVTISTTTTSSTIRYTTDGSEPTLASAAYTGPVSIATTSTLKAAGFRADWAQSDTRSSTYTMNFGTLSAPTASPAAGTYVGQVTVSLSALPGATIRYTTTGSEPNNTSSPVYTQPIVLSTTTTLKAKAYHPDYATSPTSTQLYTLSTEAPTLSLPTGAYAPGEAVVLTHPDPSATIRITLNGADPTASDPSVVSGMSLTLGGFVLRARAFRTGANDSAVVEATYSLTERFGPGMASAGTNYSTMATPDGLVYAWGYNNRGQLGDGSTTTRASPRLVQTLTGVTRVAAGASHTLALTFDGHVFAWGYNSDGQLGDGTSSQRQSPSQVSTLSNVVAIAAGSSHSLALTADGQLYAWGANASGQLGLDSTGSVSVPTLVSALTDVSAIAAGSSHSVAVTSSGHVYCWGSNSSGQLGDGTQTNRTTPTLVSGLGAVSSIAVGTDTTFVRLPDGAVYKWGASVLTPTLVADLTAANIEGGGAHRLALRDDGVLLAWGSNGSGQIGDGTTTTRSSPVIVAGPVDVAAFSAGSLHSLAVTPAGAIWTWGRGSEGQLGQGSYISSRATPQAVTTIAGTWGNTAAPFVTPATGTYNTPQTAVVTAAAGTTVRYTTSGAEPTEADPVVPSTNEIPVIDNTTLRLRAWSTDRAPSAIVTRAYVLQPVTPTITPAGGLYTSAQTVSLTTATGETTIRYTLDGTEPTETSTLYSAPFPVGTRSTVKARAFRTGWSGSETASTLLTFSYGTLAAPVPSPASGTYDAGQLVTLTASAGTIIRYTIDGSTPSESSPVYAAPVSVGVSGTRVIRARAFRVDYTDSPLMSATYAVDANAPEGATLTSIVITPQELSLPLDAAARMFATGTYSNGAVRDVTVAVAWSSSDVSVTSVDSTGVVTGVSIGEIEIRATLAAVSGVASISVTSSRFSNTGQMVRARTDHRAVRLANGNVLAIGGTDPWSTMGSELYDPVTGTFTASGNMTQPREGYTATLLSNGKVLVAGGFSRVSLTYLASAELYDPATGTFVATGSLNYGRGYHSATLLNDGKVLIVGGSDTTFNSQPIAELFDPATGSFTTTGSLVVARGLPTSVRLADGMVLIVGGSDGSGASLASGETYNPTTGVFTATGNMHTANQQMTATLLQDGRVLVAGGVEAAAAELYDPSARTFSYTGTSMVARSNPTATLLNDGQVLILGGTGLPGVAELYDPATASFHSAGVPRMPRAGATATLLDDGAVLIAGGVTLDTSRVLRSAEIYQTASTLPSPTSIEITPAAAHLPIGATRRFTAVDQFGRPRPEATWTVSDASIAELDGDQSGGLTGVAPGQVTLTATVLGVSASANMTVSSESSLPPGAIKWSISAAPEGMTPQEVIQTVAPGGGPSFYFLDSSATHTLIRAVGADGQQMWQALGPVANRHPLRDGYGGLVLTAFNGCDMTNPLTLVNVDFEGIERWRFEGASACTHDTPQLALRRDGSIVVATPGNLSGYPPVLILDGKSGTVLATPPIPPSTFTDGFGQQIAGYSRIGTPMVDADGVAYVAYEVREVAYPPRVISATLWLLRIAPDNTLTRIEVASTTDDENLSPGRIIPDGSGGVLVTWTVSPTIGALGAYPFKVGRVSSVGGVVEYELPLSVDELERESTGVPVNPMLALGESGSAFASYGTTLVAFAVSSGTLQWSYSTAPNRVQIIASTDENGVVAKASGTSGVTILRFSSTGSFTASALAATDIEYAGGALWAGVVAGQFVALTHPPISVSTSGWVSPRQAGTNQQATFIYVPDPRMSDPEQTVIRQALQRLRAELVAESQLNPQPQRPCSAWLASRPGGLTGPQQIDLVLGVGFPPRGDGTTERFGHGVVSAQPVQVVQTVDTVRTYAFVFGSNRPPGGPTGVPDYFSITINDSGGFFHAFDPSVPSCNSRRQSPQCRLVEGTFTGGSFRAQLRILVHELAHLNQVPGFLADGGGPANAAAQRSNDEMVGRNCDRFIERLTP